MISSGTSQLFVGSLLDSFGRYKLLLAALAGFSIASFIIALTANIELIYLMRNCSGVYGGNDCR
jgi:DHA1 family bicyclomycin/chloramphenicol resistance-like MFS transporter